MAKKRYPEDACELVTMLEAGTIDIFDTLEYAPKFVDDKRGMSRLRSLAKDRERARNKSKK